MNTTEYKKLHELFMQNNHGSTALHTFLCIFFTVQCTILCAIQKKRTGLYQFIYEYVIIIFSMVLIHTIFNEYIFTCNLLFVALILKEINKECHHLDIKNSFQSNFLKEKINSVSCLRALTYLITALCILAVDFKDFPRYLAKTERYGYSLMDTGVGLFVLMSGLVHKDTFTNSYISILKGNLKFIVILLTLGIVRFVSIKQLDYHEHVTEYGVHWNFFFTLAVCKILSTVLLLLPMNLLMLSTSILIIHEYLLYMGLQDWVFSNAKRTNVIDANREGISSSLGYVFLYIFAVHVKMEVNKKSNNRTMVIRKLLLYSILFIISASFIHVYRPTSRTLANAGYCTYLCTLLTSILFIMYTLELLFKNNKLRFEVPEILIAINSNGLLYFLVCNIFTGVINMCFWTLLMPSLPTFVLLNCYMLCNITLIVLLNKYGIKI